MTEEELRRVLQDIVADKDRRAEDRIADSKRKKVETQLVAIAAYTALITLFGGIILWAGDARTGQLLKPLSDDQIAMKGEIKAQKENTDELKQTVKEGFSEIKALLKK
jgi:cell division protein FtsB